MAQRLRMKWGRRLIAGVEKTKSTTADGTRNDEKTVVISNIFKPGIRAESIIDFNVSRRASVGLAMTRRGTGIAHNGPRLMSSSALR